jgi:hypothetical protein
MEILYSIGQTIFLNFFSSSVPNIFCSVNIFSEMQAKTHTIVDKQTPWFFVQKRIILTERPPLVGEI